MNFHHDQLAWAGWRFPLLDIDGPQAEVGSSRPPPEGRSAGAIGAVAVALGLALGGLAWAWWRRSRQRPRLEPERAPASPPSAPRPTKVWIPRTVEQIERLVGTARAWLKMVPEADDFELTRVVWMLHWRDVPFPDRRLREQLGFAQALELVSRVVAAARVERSESSIQEPYAAEEEVDEPNENAEASEPTVTVCDTPTPGALYRVREGDELLGEHGIAARALSAAVLEAAPRRGWTAERARTLARTLAGEATMRAAYAGLIERGEWNGRWTSALAEGVLLWLPPLRRRGLLSRSRQRSVAVDPRRWPDGSSKLEPPPALRERRRCGAGGRKPLLVA